MTYLTSFFPSEYFPPTKDDLPESSRSSSSPSKIASPGPADGQTTTAATTSESLAASLPDPPTTDPKSADEPAAKKHKVQNVDDDARLAEMVKKSQAKNNEDEDEFEGFPDDEQSHNAAAAPAEASHAIEEEWEEIRKDEVAADMDAEPMLVDAAASAATLQAQASTKDVMADHGEVDGQAAPAVPPPNMLAKDW